MDSEGVSPLGRRLAGRGVSPLPCLHLIGSICKPHPTRPSASSPFLQGRGQCMAISPRSSVPGFTIVYDEVVPKCCYREGDTPSRTLPRPDAYPMGSRFIPLAQDVAQMADTWELRAPIRVFRGLGDLFGMTST